MVKTIFIIVIVIAAVAGVWFFWPKQNTGSENNTGSQLVARNGLHWHSNLTIKIMEEYQDILAGIGLEGLPHNPLHTHDRDNVLHMEFEGPVLKEDLRVGKFFKIWGKTFSKDCIFDKCSGQEGKLKMLVNGKENSEFENYVMQDGDKIEIIFEQNVAPESTNAETREITIVGNEFSFSPSEIAVKSGQKTKIIFENKGKNSHDLVIDGLGARTKMISGGQTDIIEFTASRSGIFNIICSVPGHKEAGMRGVFKVE